jgi:hypothetical protein
MKRARIISSNSHIDYVARIFDEPDESGNTGDGDFNFAQFVSFHVGTGEIVGVIYDSKLINPQFTSFGPRLSRRSGLSELAPDHVNEQTALIGIILLGKMDGNGGIEHGVPPGILSPGLDAYPMNKTDVKRFHTSADGSVQLHYYSQVKANAGLLAVPLIESIIDQLLPECSETDSKRLQLLKQTLVWERTIGSVRS